MAIPEWKEVTQRHKDERLTALLLKNIQHALREVAEAEIEQVLNRMEDKLREKAALVAVNLLQNVEIYENRNRLIIEVRTKDLKLT